MLGFYRFVEHLFDFLVFLVILIVQQIVLLQRIQDQQRIDQLPGRHLREQTADQPTASDRPQDVASSYDRSNARCGASDDRRLAVEVVHTILQFVQILPDQRVKNEREALVN